METESQTPLHPEEISTSIARIEGLLEKTEDVEKIRVGLGMRLALGMAEEIRKEIQVGSETGPLVADWAKTYEPAVIEDAIQIAREFLLKPGDMRKLMASRLGLKD